VRSNAKKKHNARVPFDCESLKEPPVAERAGEGGGGGPEGGKSLVCPLHAGEKKSKLRGRSRGGKE